MSNYFTGVGSRNITKKEFNNIIWISNHLSSKGYTLRSGKARGADEAFQLGVEKFETDQAFNKEARIGYAPEIYTPWNNFKTEGLSSFWDIPLNDIDKDLVDEAKSIASRIHPAWGRCSQAAKKLHTRNVFQVLGRNLNNPSKFLLACSDEDSNGDVKGGTRTAWMIAKENNVPVFNVRGKIVTEVLDFVESVNEKCC